MPNRRMVYSLGKFRGCGLPIRFRKTLPAIEIYGGLHRESTGENARRGHLFNVLAGRSFFSSVVKKTPDLNFRDKRTWTAGYPILGSLNQISKASRFLMSQHFCETIELL